MSARAGDLSQLSNHVKPLNILVFENGYDNSRAICTVCRVPLRESARWGQNSKYAFDAGPTCRPVSKSQTFRAPLSPIKPSRRPPAAVTSRSEAIVVLHYCQEPTFVLGQRLFLVSIQVGLQSCSSAIAAYLRQPHVTACQRLISA